MSKAACFVISYSAAIVVLFVIFCFLMTTVNPPPLKIEDKKSSEISNNNLAEFYLRSMDPSDEVEYGLEKIEDSPEIPMSEPFFSRNLTNSLVPVKYKNPNLSKVYPPIWPPKTSVTIQFINSTNILANNTDKSTNSTKMPDVRNMTGITSLLDSPVKGHRRSVNNIESKTIDGSVILKILDNSGQSRIEIKLSPNEIFEQKRSRMHRSSVKKDSQFSMIINGQDTDIIDELFDETEKTEIRILPNDTVIINKLRLDNKTEDFTNRTTKSTNTIKSTSTKSFTNVVKRMNGTETTKNVFLRRAIEPVTIVGLLEKTTQVPLNKNMTYVTKNLQPNLTLTERFRLDLGFNNVTKSFTKPYIIHAVNKTY